MSEYLQSGQHPDADQLNAFVEDALPPHERESTLAHLARCGDCRRVVALSSEFLDAAAAPEAKPVRKPWFAGWQLGWAVAGLAAIVVPVIYFRSVVLHPRVGPEIAIARAPAPPSSLQTTPGPAAAPTPPDAPRVMAKIESRPAPVASATAALPPRPVLRPPSPGSPGIAGRGLVGGAGTGFAPHYGVSRGTGTDIVSSQPQDAIANSGRNASAVQLGSASAAPRAASAPPPPAPVSSSTVEVSAGTPVLDTPTTSDASVLSAEAVPLTRSRLPSRLPALSVATHADETVAIDSKGKVFLSTDDGKSWNRVSYPWHGRAVVVAAIIPVTSPGLAAPRQADAVSVGANGAVSSKASAPMRGSSSLTGTIGDASGAVIPGANVTVSSSDKATSKSARTDGSGRYLLGDLPPGTYTLAAQAPGFTDQRIAGVALAANEQRKTNLTLQVGQQAETVTVESETPSLRLEKAKRMAPASLLLPVFEVTTDSGEHWVSADGRTWKLR